MSSTTTLIGRTERFAWSRRIQQLGRLSSARINRPQCTDEICSEVCCTSINELHERICAPYTSPRPRNAATVTRVPRRARLSRPRTAPPEPRGPTPTEPLPVKIHRLSRRLARRNPPAMRTARSSGGPAAGGSRLKQVRLEYCWRIG